MPLHDRMTVGLLALVCMGGCYGDSASVKTVDQATPTVALPVAQDFDQTISTTVHFRDVTQESGVNWTCRNGEEAGLFAILETFGAGCAVADFDRDGRLDLFLGGGGTIGPGREIRSLPMALERQIADWQFANVAALAGLEPIRHYHHGLCTADIDHDGFTDLLLTGWEGLQLFRNQGDGTFIDVTDHSGLHDRQWSLAAAWADLNQDHHLDLFVGHYVDWSPTNNPVCIDTRLSQRMICDPTRFHGLPCMVYLSRGDGTYRDGSEELGIHEIGKALGVVVADFNGDHRPDVYVTNDTLPNQLFQSQPTGSYREVGIETGVALGESGSSDGSMGVDVGDIDGDGNLDIGVTNFENQSFALYRKLDRDLFLHASQAYGLTAVGASAVGFGTVMFDADGDGYTDIFCTNGHISAPNVKEDRRQLPYLFQNVGGQRMVNVAPFAGDYLSQRHLGRGCATGDFDESGTLDLVVTHNNEPVALLRNETPVANWLAVELIGTTSPRCATGAIVKVTGNNRTQSGVVKGGGSYLSTSNPTVHFGLGDQKLVDRLEVEWPSGRKSVLKELLPNRRLQIVEETDEK